MAEALAQGDAAQAETLMRRHLDDLAVGLDVAPRPALSTDLADALRDQP